MNVTAIPTPDDLPKLESELAELRAALEASAERVKSSHGTVHSLAMSHDDLLGRYHTLKARVEHLRTIAPLMRAGVISPPPETVTKYGARRSLRKLGDVFSNVGVIHKAAIEQCLCGSSFHRLCVHCGECSRLCGHESLVKE